MKLMVGSSTFGPAAILLPFSSAEMLFPGKGFSLSRHLVDGSVFFTGTGLMV